MMTLNITVIVRSNPGLIIEQALLRAARGPDCLWQRVCSSTCTAMMIMRMMLMMMIFVITMMITMIVIYYIFLLINLDHNTFYKFVTARFRIQIQNRFPSTPLNTLHFAGKRGSNRSRKDRASSTTLHGNVRPYDFWGQLSTCCTSCQLKHFIEGRNC